MATTDQPTLNDILLLARRLPPADQARLVSSLAASVAASLVARTEPSAGDAWQALLRLQADLRALGPSSPSSTEELIASRR